MIAETNKTVGVLWSHILRGPPRHDSPVILVLLLLNFITPTLKRYSLYVGYKI